MKKTTISKIKNYSLALISAFSSALQGANYSHWSIAIVTFAAILIKEVLNLLSSRQDTIVDQNDDTSWSHDLMKYFEDNTTTFMYAFVWIGLAIVMWLSHIPGVVILITVVPSALSLFPVFSWIKDYISKKLHGSDHEGFKDELLSVDLNSDDSEDDKTQSINNGNSNKITRTKVIFGLIGIGAAAYVCYVGFAPTLSFLNETIGLSDNASKTLTIIISIFTATAVVALFGSGSYTGFQSIKNNWKTLKSKRKILIICVFPICFVASLKMMPFGSEFDGNWILAVFIAIVMSTAITCFISGNFASKNTATKAPKNSSAKKNMGYKIGNAIGTINATFVSGTLCVAAASYGINQFYKTLFNSANDIMTSDIKAMPAWQILLTLFIMVLGIYPSYKVTRVTLAEFGSKMWDWKYPPTSAAIKLEHRISSSGPVIQVDSTVLPAMESCPK